VAATAALANTISETDRRFYAGKLHACRFFFEWELPKVDPQLRFVASHSDVASAMPLDAF
jgi:butyryl-CoA dehydrogenase